MAIASIDAANVSSLMRPVIQASWSQPQVEDRRGLMKLDILAGDGPVLRHRPDYFGALGQPDKTMKTIPMIRWKMGKHANNAASPPTT